MTEADMQRFFGKYLEDNPPRHTEVYELKFTSGKSIRFDAVKPHQREALEKASYGLYHKLTDPPIFYGARTRFNVLRPFDCFFIRGARAYVVVWFYKPRQKKIFIGIPYNAFLEMEVEADRKSFTEEMALNSGMPLTIS